MTKKYKKWYRNYSNSYKKEMKYMNFYEELEGEFKNAGIKGKIVPVSEDLKPIPIDIAELDARIEKRIEENRNMMFLSEMYAANNMPCGNIELTKQIKTKKLINNKRM